ncbi:MAG: hypothetical protein FJX77_09995, partial [Armatimonadetes bacterium]|nr:hypothetical protein [Armatimonadota bacterium]
MSPTVLLSRAREAHITLWREGDGLCYRTAGEPLSPAWGRTLREHKWVLLPLLPTEPPDGEACRAPESPTTPRVVTPSVGDGVTQGGERLPAGPEEPGALPAGPEVSQELPPVLLPEGGEMRVTRSVARTEGKALLARRGWFRMVSARLGGEVVLILRNDTVSVPDRYATLTRYTLAEAAALVREPERLAAYHAEKTCPPRVGDPDTGWWYLAEEPEPGGTDGAGSPTPGPAEGPAPTPATGAPAPSSPWVSDLVALVCDIF